jgi:hypothetical protein
LSGSETEKTEFSRVFQHKYFQVCHLKNLNSRAVFQIARKYLRRLYAEVTMKTRRAGVAKMVVLILVPVIPLAALPVVHRYQSYQRHKQSREATALLPLAAAGRPLPEIQRLLDQGADVNGDFRGRTGLIYAAAEGRPEIVSLLLSRGARVNHVGQGRETALSLAKQQMVVHKKARSPRAARYPVMIQMLKDAGAKE